MNIFVSCTSEKVDDQFLKRSLFLITEIAKIKDLNLVFCASNHGVMKSFYEIFKNHEKKVTGIALHSYKNQLDNLELDQAIFVKTSMERMIEVYEKSDIFLFLPGGIETYTELLSCIEEHQTRGDQKLLIIYNDDFFYTPFIKEMYQLYERKFVPKSIGEYVRIESREEEIVKLIEKEKELLWKN